MGLQLDLEKPLNQILVDNKIPTTGARRRRRGGADSEEIEAARPAAQYGLTVVLKKAYDILKTAGSATTQAAVAAAIIAAADQAFRADLCDPLAKSLASTLSVVPVAAAFVTKCDNSMVMYNTAVTSAAFLVAPLLMNALRTAGSIFVSDETVDKVAGDIIEAAKNPAAAASRAMSTRSQVRALEGRRGGRRLRKTKKRTTRKRSTRRRTTFSY